MAGVGLGVARVAGLGVAGVAGVGGVAGLGVAGVAGVGGVAGVAGLGVAGVAGVGGVTIGVARVSGDTTGKGGDGLRTVAVSIFLSMYCCILFKI